MATSVEQICNQALLFAEISYRIGDIYEGTPEAKVALELYGQARDELLDLKDWSFNRRTAPLTLLKGPPPAGGYNFGQPWSNIYPAPGWLYEYQYPSDCVDLRDIIEQPGQMPDLDPVPARWRVDNDPTPNLSGNPPVASGPEDKVIFCNITSAFAVYRSRVIDPSVFDPGYTAALVELLGTRMRRGFGAAVDKAREDMNEAQATANVQADVRG